MIQPVSTCYVPDLTRVYREVARVTVAGGLYISQHKQPPSLQASTEPTAAGYPLTEPYYRTGPLPEVVGSPHREPGTLEFLHRLETLIGGMCRAGFSIEDLVEPLHADEASRDRHVWAPQPLCPPLCADQSPANRLRRRLSCPVATCLASLVRLSRACSVRRRVRVVAGCKAPSARSR